MLTRLLAHLRRALVRPILSLILALVLAGCNGGDEVPNLELQVIQYMGQAISEKTTSKTTRPPVTRAVLDTLEGSFLEVTLERRDQLAYLYVSATRQDDGPGRVTVWRTNDNITLAMRNGVLIATRGMGGDILSSTVQVAGTVPGPSGGGEKILSIRALDNKVQRLALVCDLSDLGSQVIVIVERRHTTRHLRETCTGGIAGTGAGVGVRVGEVVNEYWVDSQTGLVLQSRQWAGPFIGYLRLRRLTY